MKLRALPFFGTVLALAILGAGPAPAVTGRGLPNRAPIEKVLFSFSGTDGANPFGGLVFDGAGNLYGATPSGGVNGNGTVYQLRPAAGGGWTERVLHTFAYGAGAPFAPLIVDAKGSLYDTTSGGHGPFWGTVFELSPGSAGWTYRIIHSFIGPSGRFPIDSPVMDAAGNLYGTAFQGGRQDAGTVFELKRRPGGHWATATLHSFTFGRADGFGPYAGVIFEASGKLYGTTEYGGSPSCGRTPSGSGCGVAFELTPSTRGERVVHTFRQGPGDGANPIARLVADSSGTLYGTTGKGGANGLGTVYALQPAAGRGWKERILYNFAQGSGGNRPSAALVLDKAGNLYGTTYSGGNTQTCGSSGLGCGVAFELVRGSNGAWTYTVLYRFAGGSDGMYPHSELIFDAAGNLYGTTALGGAHGVGTVFEITP